MEYPYRMNVLEQCQVSPPPGSVPDTYLPLTFFDLLWLGMTPPVQRIYFYELNCSKAHFMDSIIPDIKSSLSVSLRHFFPLAGNLIWSPESYKPEVLYVDGDSVSLTVAESALDFSYLSSNQFRDLNKLHSLVPQSLQSISNTRIPLMALQITFFQNIGISIGIAINHVVADGSTSTQFMKFWAAVCKLDMLESFPSYDRTTITDPHGWELAHLNSYQSRGITRESLNLPKPSLAHSDNVLATFILGQAEIEKLKKWVSARNVEGNIYSTFVVVCAYIWVCMSKAVGSDNDREHFLFPVNGRALLEPALPVTYFGNCLLGCCSTVFTGDLHGEIGIAVAAESIRKELQMVKADAIKGPEKTMPVINWKTDRLVTVAGSPNLRVYDTDFGWGRPKKVEIVSITEAISLAERSDGEVGVEIGLAKKESAMNTFSLIFKDTLTSL